MDETVFLIICLSVGIVLTLLQMTLAFIYLDRKGVSMKVILNFKR